MTDKKIKELIAEITSTKPIKLQIKGSRENAPRSIHYYNSKKQFVPDIVAIYKDKKDFYSIEKEFNENDISMLTFKWILFSAEARKTSGTFFLVLDKSNAAACKKIISHKVLEIELIEL